MQHVFCCVCCQHVSTHLSGSMSPAWLEDSEARLGPPFPDQTLCIILSSSHHEYYASDQTLLSHERVTGPWKGCRRYNNVMKILLTKSLFKCVALPCPGKDVKPRTKEVIPPVSVKFLKGQSSPVARITEQHTSRGFFPHGIFFLPSSS